MVYNKINNLSHHKHWFIFISILLIFIIILLSVGLFYLFFYKSDKNINTNDTNDIYPKSSCPLVQPHIDNLNLSNSSNSSYSNNSNNSNNSNDNNNDIPVFPKNLPQFDTNSHTFQQIGILTANEFDKDPIVLPLFARKVFHHKDRWQYFTATDKNNMMRLPIKIGNTNCEDDIGCFEIYDGDKIIVDIYQGRSFNATIYKKNSPKYFADLY